MNQILELQKMSLEILSEFKRVAARENLTWYVMFGTLLGAVRHKGFIPWDDDVDIVMPRADYDRLRAFPGMFAEPYFLQTTENDPAAAPRFLKLMRSDTTNITEFPNVYTRGGHMGIHIDIVPMEHMPDEATAARIHSAAHRLHEQMFASAAFDESGDSDVPDFKDEDCYRWGGVAGAYGFFADCYEKTCSRFSDGQYYAMPSLYAPRGSQLYEKEWFAESVEMDFAGLKVPAPVGWREALEITYPEGLRAPEMSLRLPTVINRVVDLECSYKKYSQRYTDMLVGIENKKVYIFGAGDSLRIWLERYGLNLNVVCAFDNDRGKWGGYVYGTLIQNPAELPELMDEDSRLIIASIYHKEIGEQLRKMRVNDYYIFIDGWNYGR